MNRISHKISSFLENTKEILINYPLVLIYAFLSSVFAIFAVESTIITYTEDGISRPWALANPIYEKLVLIFGLGISLAILGYAIKTNLNKFLIPFLSLVLLSIYFYVFPNNFESFTHRQWIVLACIFILQHLAVAFLPPLINKKDDFSFWQYNVGLFENAIKAILFSGVFTLGVILAVAAIEQLFDVKLGRRGSIYFNIFLFSAIFITTYIYLLFIDKEKTFTSVDKKPIPTVLRYFVQYILTPLLLLYGVILYAYSIKILIDWSLPQGWISTMILVFCGVGLLSKLLIYPMIRTKENLMLSFFNQWFYWSIIPQLALLFLAIYTRVDAYGFTPMRYFLSLIALWLVLVTIYFIFSKSKSITFIPKTLFILLLAGTFFPYLNAFDVSLNSQEKRFSKLVHELDILEDGKINFNRPISSKDVNQLGDVALFLHKFDRKEAVNLFLAETITDSIFSYSYSSGYNFRRQFTNIQIEVEVGDWTTLLVKHNAIENWRAVDIAGYDFLIRDSHRSALDNDLFISVESFLGSYNGDTKHMKLLLTDNVLDTIDSVDVFPFLEQVFFRNLNEENPKIDFSESDEFVKEIFTDKVFIEKLEFPFILKGFEGKIIFDSIRFGYPTKSNDEKVLIEDIYIHPQYIILIKKQ